MVNKLDMLFSNQPTNNTRFAAFMLWLSNATKIAVKAAIMFHIGREYIVMAATQLAKDSNKKLLLDPDDAPLAIKIGRLLKGPKFSLLHPGSPSPALSPFKKQRLNLNTPPSQTTYTRRARMILRWSWVYFNRRQISRTRQWP